MNTDQIFREVFAILPRQMDSVEARIMLVACGLQESRMLHRRQLGDGPARGLWQFERGTEISRGGVWGVYVHEASRYWLHELCSERRVAFAPAPIWSALETDDVLAAGVARLLLFTDPRPLPKIGEVDLAWIYYVRNWRPGKPRRETWPANYAAACAAAMAVAA